jgi:hypothetical protein
MNTMSENGIASAISRVNLRCPDLRLLTTIYSRVRIWEFYLFLVNLFFLSPVNAADVHSELCKAGTLDKSYIACSNHGYVRGNFLKYNSIVNIF